MSHGQLARTGAGAVSVLGVAVTETWLLVAAAVLVATGVTLLRLTWRREGRS